MADRTSAQNFARAKGVVAALAASLMTTACAGTSTMLGGDSTSPAPQAQAGPVSGADELQKATEYWRQAYLKKPTDAKAALNYAKNLKAMGQKRQALQVLQQASGAHSSDREIKSEYGRLALELDQVSVAKRLLAAADNPNQPDWRVISARGTVLAKEGQFAAAIPFYERALSLAPNQPSVQNNLALAHLMNGHPQKAEGLLQKAAASGGPNASKLRQNLSLALGLQGKHIESQSIASSVQGTAQAAANAKYMKKLLQLDAPSPAVAAGPRKKAVVRTVAKSKGSNASNVGFKPATY
jgi:Flp pilus assembly protein TadD